MNPKKLLKLIKDYKINDMRGISLIDLDYDWILTYQIKPDLIYTTVRLTYNKQKDVLEFKTLLTKASNSLAMAKLAIIPINEGSIYLEPTDSQNVKVFHIYTVGTSCFKDPLFNMIINNKLANIINNHKELVKGLCDKFDILNNQITIGKVSFNDDLNDEDEDDFEEIDPENYI